MQTLGVIRIQLIYSINVLSKYSSLISHRPSIFEGRHIDHRSSKIDTSITDLRRSTHQSPIFEGRHVDLRRSTHRSSKGATSMKIEGRNITPTIRHRILSTTALQFLRVDHRYYRHVSIMHLSMLRPTPPPPLYGDRWGIGGDLTHRMCQIPHPSITIQCQIPTLYIHTRICAGTRANACAGQKPHPWGVISWQIPYQAPPLSPRVDAVTHAHTCIYIHV